MRVARHRDQRRRQENARARRRRHSEDAVRIMEGKQIRRLPVLDEAMQMVGMVSLGDVSHALPRDITGEVAKAVSAHHP